MEEVLMYHTVPKRGKGAYEEKKSRFLAQAIPVKEKEKIAEELQCIKKQHYDARHHCYAFVLGEKGQIRKAVDDGEPQGTAGLPILKVIEGYGCTNVLVVVTRYFGGTLLGTGGLVRSYTAAAKAAMEDAGIVCMKEGEVLELVMEYSCLSSVTYFLKKENIVPDEMIYEEKVRARIRVPKETVAFVREKLFELSGAKIMVHSIEKGFYGF